MSAFRRTVNPPCHPVRPTPLRSAIALPSFADRPPEALARVPRHALKSRPADLPRAGRPWVGGGAESP